MKILAVAVAMLAAGHDSGVRPDGRQAPQAEEKKTEGPATKVDEKAYKAALERIPDAKEKYDPWGVARPAGRRRRLSNHC